MEHTEFERLNALSEKAMNDKASPNELKEFNTLLSDWNDSAELNMFNKVVESSY